ncbi:MAG: type IV pilus twitching motility protein PilT [Candidatus Pacebacteria bacterium]|nr:type IV pilus twitching motility protein PilT [Candidatus Paceibacterota bacterium]
MENNKYKEQLNELLQTVIDENGSDLHISAGHFPIIRINGKLISLTEKKMVTSHDAREIAMEMMNRDQKEKFLSNYELDFSYHYKNIARFRVNIFFQQGEISCAMRLIPIKIKTLEEINMPPAIYDFCNSSQGFVIITGPTGHGKSTTLAALIDKINQERFDHIITIEDPIEYVFEEARSLIDQREIHRDTLSFPRALKSVFRQDPDVIMVGEMRDPVTISTAITAAETGHLVFSTLHTNSASQTIHRIIDSFPSEQQNQVRAQLSSSLLGIVSQRLIPGIEKGIVPACEIMIRNHAVANLIRENKIHEIDLIIETSFEQGMVSLNRSLVELVKNNLITKKNALNYALNPVELRRMLG